MSGLENFILENFGLSQAPLETILQNLENFITKVPFQEKITTLKILTLENFRLYSSYCLWVSSIARPLSVQALDNQVNNGQILSVDTYVRQTQSHISILLIVQSVTALLETLMIFKQTTWPKDCEIDSYCVAVRICVSNASAK